ncbi:pyruvate formate lyase activating enzyme [Mobilisporobacter senegalensis]|uniref:Pyruvate formate-lyase-activating enzyme n=1 Tax=Mobilisporobacter senegalensis TaxID=1329262 RepID=A0A3N1XKY1_9FIRM|nr:pyruvate formate-lyase-activating protein [Mobilisporobacter senegalensis]ROR25712.1 pyruvate formate lyase activating enzyme [Mobilisporobacter senegalensis]
MKGYIHSTESFGTVDGPGIRYVVFMQGCPMRCKYCHNPDTWDLKTGKEVEVDDILKEYESYRNFLKDGGITATGGEPMMQMDFLIELFEKAKEKEIHTCLDTSGIVFNENNPRIIEKIDRLLSVTDLIMLDIKHIDPVLHEDLTGQTNDQILAFSRYLDKKKVPVWIRHVVVPTITDDEEYLDKLGYFIGDLTNVKALDVLPYHDMGKAKYQELGIDYPLADLKSIGKSEAIKARNTILKGMKRRLLEKKSQQNG